MRSTRTAWRGSASSGVPPRTASSALTPSDLPRSLTMSMKGCGNVFSRPIRSPMTLAPLLDICADHLLPVRPIVRPAGPQVEPDFHPLLAHQPCHLDRVGYVRVLLAG